MATTGTATAERQRKLLLDLATPQLYRHNPFRVLGAAVDDAPREVQRKIERRRRRQRFGTAANSGDAEPLALTAPAGDDDLRVAMERLSRPFDRLLDELFWFWPLAGPSRDDPSLQALAANDQETARTAWEAEAGAGDSRPAAVAVHNLAVLNHLRALEFEAASGTAKPAVHGDRAALWRDAYRHWQRTVDNDEFWRALERRRVDLDDPQLGPDVIASLRASLPVALLAIGARLARDAAEHDDPPLVRSHLQLLRNSAFDAGDLEQALRQALEPVRARVRGAIDEAQRRWRANPQQGDIAVREMHQQADAPLKVIDTMLPAEDPTRVGLHDTLAEAMLEGQVAFGKATNDWPACIALLREAMNVASGDAMKAKLTENIGILEDNQRQGNDWCSRGYWDLPPEARAQLEAARKKCQVDEHVSAINDILALDPALGQPLRRCLAYALNQAATRLANRAIDEHQQPSSKLKRFLEVIDREGSVKVPFPSMESWQAPPCPCCGDRHYTRWANGEYNRQKYWMCSSCSETADRELKGRRSVFKAKIGESLEHLILAHEVDPGDTGVTSNLVSLKKVASELDVALPSTRALRERLTGGKPLTNRRQVPPPASAAGGACLFCELPDAVDSCRIAVPLASRKQSADMLLGRGFEYSTTEVVVLRCVRCHGEHQRLKSRLALWREARVEATADHHFPSEVQQVAIAVKALADGNRAIKEAQAAVAVAEQEVGRADALGSLCERCGAKGFWPECMCASCDAKLHKLSPAAWTGVISAALVPWSIALAFGRDAPNLASQLGTAATGAGLPTIGVAASLLLAGVVYGVIRARQVGNMREVQRTRQNALRTTREEAAAKAQRQLETARTRLAKARVSGDAQRVAQERAQQALQAQKDQVLLQRDRVHPEPVLPPGLKPESAFSSHPAIVELLGHGWAFGSTPADEAGAGSRQPEGIVGLVDAAGAHS